MGMPMAPARTVVITGASAGVGRATALAFARRGWNVAVIARDRGGLESTAREIEHAGGGALAISADVADADSLFRAADTIVERWGAIDVWVNNAMCSVFAPVAEMTPDEYRRVTEVTYLGYVYGTMAALKYMRRSDAGAVLQVGSALAYRAIPLQSAYCAAKFAIRGFTDSLRSELLHDASRVRITMVQLPAVNTPQFTWSRNKMPRRAKPIPPIYRPEAVAERIFQASQSPRRELWVGFATVKAIIGTMAAPGSLDRYLAGKGYEGQLTREPRNPAQPDNLFEPVADAHAMHGRFDRAARSKVAGFQPAAIRAGVIVSVAAIFAVALLACLP